MTINLDSLPRYIPGLLSRQDLPTVPDQSGRITRARSILLLDHPWFGALSLRLRIVADPACPTMSVDGTTLRYGPAYAAALTDLQLVGILAHEVLHCGLLHPYRSGGRDLKRWNEACDHVVNGLLKAQGFTLPDGMIYDAKYDGLAAEQIYATMAQEPPPPPQQSQQPQPDFTPPQQPQEPQQGQPDDTQDGQDDQPAPDGQGQPDPNGTPDDGQGDQDPQPQDGPGQPMTAADWQIAAEQAAMVARKAGNMDGNTDRSLKASRDSGTDWRTILHRFIEQTIPQDYSWTAPNRRYISAGIYLPGTVKENTPRLGVAIDTSASIGRELLDLFATELTAILHDTRPIALDVVYCDTRVQGTQTFTPDDDEVTLEARGGGGTRFQPALDWFSDQDEPPAAVIYLTDLEGSAPEEPAYPVLWATAEYSTEPAPFGEVVRLSSWS